MWAFAVTLRLKETPYLGLGSSCLSAHLASVETFSTSQELGGEGMPKVFFPWVALGYRITPQESTKLSPYEMMFACKPDLPSAHREKLREPVNFDDPKLASQSIVERAKLIQNFIPIAGRNLLIAQHRDTKRYAKLRSGGYLPSVIKFVAGQFVYVRTNDALHKRARPEILRVVDVRPSGVLVLMGQCGNTIAVNAVNCSPCHLPIKDQDKLPVVDVFRPRKEFA